MNLAYSPFISVIIPVFNDAQHLKKCLAALDNQTYPKELYEVIVVDNASDEDIRSVTNCFTQASITFEESPGSYAARNKGISVAKGEVIAFTDADCIPTSNWIEKGVENLLQVSNCGLVAGRIEFYFKISEQPTGVEFYDSIFHLNQKKFIEVDKFGATANLFTFASVFNNIGLFNTNLKSSGDREWGNRVFSSGYILIYADNVCVKHPARSSLKELHKKVTRLIGGNFDLNKENNIAFVTFFIDTVKLLKPPIKFIRWRLSDKSLKTLTQKNQFIFVTIFMSYAIAWEKSRLRLGAKSKRA